jgi:glyoxylase I family protein
MPIGTQNTVIPGCGTHHISIRTHNWEASLHLYRDVLGMKVVSEFGSSERPMALLDMGDGSHIELAGSIQETSTSVEISKDSKPALVNPIAHLALATTDTRMSVEHVRQAGYEITTEPRSIDLNGMGVTIAFFKGPSGEEIEFFQVHQV